MFLKKSIFLSILFVTISIFSQNMTEGFNYLETGQYAKAEKFFDIILKDYPTNKTAKLCYARALGLNGNSDKAYHLFSTLLKEYPEDFEVKLNFAESMLWSKKYEEAKVYYSTLIEENPKSFSALLGFANTLSNLKEYNEALTYVNKALEVSPKNNNALISKKYIRLGLANTYIPIKEYEKAESLLKENFIDFKDDKDTYLNLANLYLIAGEFNKAEEVYEKLRNQKENELTSLNGLALVYHLKGKEKLALETSKLAIQKLDENTYKDLTNQTKERYIQALIWNKKYKDASLKIDELFFEINPPQNWMLSLRATLNIYKSNFSKSITDYNTILDNEKSSFDGNLGKANALKALGYFDDAYKNAENTLSFYENQKDAANFIKQLNNNFTPFIDAKTSYSFDNGNNQAYMFEAATEVPFSTKFKISAVLNFRNTSNNITNLEANTKSFTFGASYQLLNNLTLNGSLGLLNSSGGANSFNQLLTHIFADIKPFKLQNLEIGYRRDIQNFNAELIDREIVQNNFYSNYNISTNFNLGWFTQYFYTSQSDNNSRNLLFTSLYYTILPKPSLKGGINYQYITFKNQVPTVYFSPEKFNAVEIFINLIKDENVAKIKSYYYDFTFATGYQFIEDGPRQSTYRVQAKIGYKFSERSLANLYASQSNIASVTAAGFTFTEIGLRFKWLFLSKPLFRN